MTKRRKATTLIDVANAANVSRWVVGYVLNGGDGNTRVSEKTAAQIREVAERLNYRPNLMAQALRGKRSGLLGLLVASAGDPLRSFLVQYLDTEAIKIGCHTLIGNTVGNTEIAPDQFDYYIDHFSRRSVDGVVCAVHNWFGGNRRSLMQIHPNTVFYEDPGIPGAAYVTVDREEALRLSIRHLVSQGRQRIGWIAASPANLRASSVEVFNDYQSILEEQGINYDPDLVFDGEQYGKVEARHDRQQHQWVFSHRIVDLAIEHFLDKRVDAIIAPDDFWAASLIRNMANRGVAVPHDIAIIGYLNHYLADWTNPPLTTIDLEDETAAREMISMLDSMIKGKSLSEARRVVKIKPQLIVRESA